MLTQAQMAGSRAGQLRPHHMTKECLIAVKETLVKEDFPMRQGRQWLQSACLDQVASPKSFRLSIRSDRDTANDAVHAGDRVARDEAPQRIEIPSVGRPGS